LYKTILVGTDGSRQAQRAVRVAARLARALDSRLFALHVTLERVPTLFSGAKLYASPALSPELRRVLEGEASRILAQAEKRARAEGVDCTRLHASAKRPWRAILEVARRRHCDLIVLGAHGSGGAVSELLGGQATRVLARAKSAVLVCR
jgi:nucleotide-binding universal stress UspA family protein